MWIVVASIWSVVIVWAAGFRVGGLVVAGN